MTTPVQARCGESEFQPAAAADLDGDGRLERIATRWDGSGYVVTLHRLPGLRPVGRQRIAADAMEVAVARTGRGRRGHAWLHTGRRIERGAGEWRSEMLALGRGASTRVWSSSTSARPNVRIDLDGDGRADPIFGDSRAWVGGRLVDIPFQATPGSFHGAPAPFGREEPVDLDRDGKLEVVVDAIDGLRVVSVPGLRTLVHAPSRKGRSRIVPWGGRYYVYTRYGSPAAGHLSALGGGGLRDIVSWTDAVGPNVGVDPAGDGSLLVMNLAGGSELRSAKSPSSVVRRLDVHILAAVDPAIARLGPVRVDADRRPDVVGVRYLSRGSPARGGTGETRYEIVILGPGGTGAPRVIRRAAISGEGGVSGGLVDLDGDGRYEILLEEVATYMNCDLDSGGGSSSRWFLLDGTGKELWTDQLRGREFGPHRAPRDATARAAVLDLVGDATRAIRFRTPVSEWYVVPGNAAVPDVIPVCLE